jgi:hypothetical protein
VGKIPNISGFADPKPFTLKVITTDGKASGLVTGLLLKPNLEFKELPILNATIAQPGPPDRCFHYLNYYGWLVLHGSELRNISPPGPIQHSCQGDDILTEGMELKNNWKFWELDCFYSCLEITSSPGNTMDIDQKEVSCRQPGRVWVAPVQGWENSYNKPNIPRVVMHWECHSFDFVDTPRTSHGVCYKCFIAIYGPEGTSYDTPLGAPGGLGSH